MKRGKKVTTNEDLIKGKRYVIVSRDTFKNSFELLAIAVSSPVPEGDGKISLTNRLKVSSDPMHYNVTDFRDVFEAIP